MPDPDWVAEVVAEHTEDKTDQMDDEEAVQSQLAREEEEASTGKASRAASPVQQRPAKLSTPTVEQPGETRMVQEIKSPMVDGQQLPEPEPEVDTFSNLMASLRDSITTLRSLRLNREQYYQAEDVLFELKRGLLEAEERGTS